MNSQSTESIVTEYADLSIEDLARSLAMHFTGPAPEGDTEKDEAYILAKPALCRLYEEDAVRFEGVARKIKAQLGHSLDSIRRDIKLLAFAHGSAGPANSNGQHPQQSNSQATRVVSLALRSCELWHTRDSEGYATVLVDGHQEHYPLRKKQFRLWIAKKFYEEEGTAIGSQAIQDALSVLEAKALFEQPEYPVFLRLAEHAGKIYLDLANDRWEAIEIATNGWQVVANPPVRFRRPRGIAPLPCPVPGGTINELRPFVNVGPDPDGGINQHFVLLVAWLLMALSPRGPYPILSLMGEQGAAKSTHARVLRVLTDPSVAPLRTTPRDERDLMISAQAGWVLAFDNLSHLSEWLSDAFCRISTGGGFATRELFTDSEEILIDVRRPQIHTAIADIALSGDILDRSVRVLLPDIDDDNRREEIVFWQDFDAAHPRILGALLDAVSTALANRSYVKLKKLPRMADFAAWVTAAETGLGWRPGTFIEAYLDNRQRANELALDASLVAYAVKALAEHHEFSGTAKELLDKLSLTVTERETAGKHWPKSALALSNVLRRLAPNLRRVGISIEFQRTAGSSSKRLIRITRKPSDASDASDAARDFAGENGDAPNHDSDATDNGATQEATQCDAHPIPSDAKNPNENNESDDSVACDAQKPTYSNQQWEKDL